MLWIQYEATESLELAYVKDIAVAIARLVAPYSVAIFDVGPFGLGLICHREIYSDEEDTESDMPESAKSVEPDSDCYSLNGNPRVGMLPIRDDIGTGKQLQTSVLTLTTLTPDSVRRTMLLQNSRDWQWLLRHVHG